MAAVHIVSLGRRLEAGRGTQSRGKGHRMDETELKERTKRTAAMLFHTLKEGFRFRDMAQV